MKTVDRYVAQVLRNVFAAPGDRNRLEADLRAHFAEAEADGRAPREISDALGAPEEVAAAFNAEREMDYASFWQRLVAFLGDAGLLMALCLPLFALLFLTSGRPGETGDPTVAWLVVFALTLVALAGIWIFYFPLLEDRFGKTFGKHLMGLRVLRENGTPIGLGQAFVRRLSLYFEMLALDAIFILFTGKRQRALDIVAKTIVAREPGRTAPPWAYAVCLLLPFATLLALLALALLGAPR